MTVSNLISYENEILVKNQDVVKLPVNNTQYEYLKTLDGNMTNEHSVGLNCVSVDNIVK